MTGAFVIKGHKTLFGVGEDRNGFKLILVVPQDWKLRGTEPFGLCHQNDSVDYFLNFLYKGYTLDYFILIIPSPCSTMLCDFMSEKSV